jgi:hypothetical protein
MCSVGIFNNLFFSYMASTVFLVHGGGGRIVRQFYCDIHYEHQQHLSPTCRYHGWTWYCRKGMLQVLKRLIDGFPFIQTSNLVTNFRNLLTL